MNLRGPHVDYTTRNEAGIALVDVLGVGTLLVLVAAVGIPTIERARELSKRSICSVNLKATGVVGASYAEANQGQWMTPPFRQQAADAEGIDYLCHGNSSFDLACVGFERNRPSRSEPVNQPSAGSTAITTTRAFWMLVRSGEASVKQFVCPSSLNDVPDPTELIQLYYDFNDYSNISYGYLVPFGPPDTRPRSNADNRVVFAADKGPYYHNVNLDPLSGGPNGTPLRASSFPSSWSRFNSPNHGIQKFGEGQNALKADGHVEFFRRPIAGADHDNIYTLMGENWDIDHFNVIHGYSPHQSPANNPFPGKETFYPNYSTTDSLIYP